ncbi:MAG: pilus assembly protein CpaE [Pseudonocardiales bacterium]|jgi:pilus assembly protein CpaE|nr:pilus assembly protein CpaE [Pseudonocardiales bacterium]
MTIVCGQVPPAVIGAGGGLGDLVYPVDGIPAAGNALLADPAETVVVLGIEVILEDALAFAEQLRIERPQVGVILLRESLDIAVLTQAIRAGIREVVPVSEAHLLIEAVDRIRQLSARVPALPAAASGAPRGQVVTVFSAKGGTGKTTISTNLAVALAEGGTYRVCLVDLDLAFGDVAISLQLNPRRTVVDALSLGEELDSAKVASLVTNYSPGLDCILAPVEPGDAEKIPASLVAEIVALLGGMYDYVVIDTPAQFSEHVLVALDASHHHVLITTPEVPALKNLRLTLDMLDLLSYSRNSRLIVFNRSDADVGLSAADVERVVKSPITAHVPSSREVPASINRGTPLTAEQPEHAVSRAIRLFAQEHVIGEPVAEVARRSGRGLRLRRR